MENTAVESTLLHDSANKTPSHLVVDAVAEAEGVDPTDLDPLFTAIDPDALDALFDPQLKVGGVADADASVQFQYSGYRVRVSAAGRVTLDEL